MKNKYLVLGSIFVVAVYYWSQYNAVFVREFPYTANEVQTVKVDQLVEELEKVGFKEVETVAIKDLDSNGDSVSDELIESVSIDGKPLSVYEKSYHTESPVKIEYHTFADDMVTYQLPLDKETFEIDVKGLKKYLKEVGFEKVSLREDPSAGITSQAQFTRMTIDGKDVANLNYLARAVNLKGEEVYFSKTSPVVIYHTTETDKLEVPQFEANAQRTAVASTFRQLGLEVTESTVQTTDKSLNGQVQHIYIDGVEYTLADLPATMEYDSQVEIFYYYYNQNNKSTNKKTQTFDESAVKEISLSEFIAKDSEDKLKDGEVYRFEAVIMDKKGGRPPGLPSSIKIEYPYQLFVEDSAGKEYLAVYLTHDFVSQHSDWQSGDKVKLTVKVRYPSDDDDGFNYTVVLDGEKVN